MDLHEYQSKDLLESFGVPVPIGHVASSVEEAQAVYKSLGQESVVVKAQVLTGGRGKAGGVKVVKGFDQFTSFVRGLLGTKLVTYQTTKEGLPVNQVLIAELTDIKKELYLSFLVDRTTFGVTCMASMEGGVEIEKVASETPDKIQYIYIKDELEAYQARQLAYRLKFDQHLITPFCKVLMSLFKAFKANDMGMLEINPLVITAEDEVVCLDSKVNIDDNALYRHKEIAQMRDLTQEDSKEVMASQYDLSYIALEGDIGCMVNGAGLAMATMDMIQVCGGKPANFLDVGGNATEERVTEAFKIIDQDENVKVVFVNIFGGIVRCDLIADGILSAIESIGLTKPLVIRLVGNRSKEGNAKLEQSGHRIIAVDDFREAAMSAVNELGAL